MNYRNHIRKKKSKMTKPEDAYAAPSGLATTDDSNPVFGFPLLVYSARVIRPGQTPGIVSFRMT